MTRQPKPALTSPEGQGSAITEGSLAAGPRRAGSLRKLAACLAACVLLTGCGVTGGTRPSAVPFGLGRTTHSLSEAVADDPFPDAAEVGLQM